VSKHRHLHERDERVITLDGYRVATRLVMDVGLLFGLAGAAIPWGMHDLTEYKANAYDWALAALAFVALVGIVVDITTRPARPWPFLLAAFVMSAHTAYSLTITDTVWGARISIAFVYVGYAVAAAGAWRIASHMKIRQQL
jgi:hypothetical protein